MYFVKMIGRTVMLLTLVFFISMLSVEAKERVNVYLFWGDGCPHCEFAKEFFDDLEGEYPNYFTLHSFEIWYDTNNRDLLHEVTSKLNKNVDLVPFIVVGSESFVGYNESIGVEIKNAIISQYESGQSNDVVATIIDKKVNIENVLEEYTGNDESTETEGNQNKYIILSLVLMGIVFLFLVYKKSKDKK